MQARVVHDDGPKLEVVAEEEAGGEGERRVRHVEPVGRALDDEVPHLRVKAARHDVDPLDGALGAEGRAQPRFDRRAQQGLREQAEGQQGEDDDDEAQQAENDRALAQRASTCPYEYLARFRRPRGRPGRAGDVIKTDFSCQSLKI